MLFLRRWNTSISANFHTKPPDWMKQNMAVLAAAMDSAGGSTRQPCDHTAFSVQ